jgi:hypothetical protein
MLVRKCGIWLPGEIRRVQNQPVSVETLRWVLAWYCGALKRFVFSDGDRTRAVVSALRWRLVNTPAVPLDAFERELFERFSFDYGGPQPSGGIAAITSGRQVLSYCNLSHSVAADMLGVIVEGEWSLVVVERNGSFAFAAIRKGDEALWDYSLIGSSPHAAGLSLERELRSWLMRDYLHSDAPAIADPLQFHWPIQWSARQEGHR